jgi:hypothetical protein
MSEVPTRMGLLMSSAPTERTARRVAGDFLAATDISVVVEKARAARQLPALWAKSTAEQLATRVWVEKVRARVLNPRVEPTAITADARAA